MAIPGLINARRTVMVVYLCLAVSVPSLMGAVIVHEQSMRQQAREETARLLLAQALGAQVDRAVTPARAILAMLATDPLAGEALASGSYTALDARFRDGLRASRIESIQLLDETSRPRFVAARNGEDSKPARSAGAGLRLHHSIRNERGVLGEVAAVVSIAALVDVSLYSQGLGQVSLSGFDGRVLADAEGSTTDVVIDVPEGHTEVGTPIEAGTTSVGPGNAVAFAAAGDLPILITVSATDVRARWPWPGLVVVDGLLLVAGWLVIGYATRERPARDLPP